MLFTFKRDDEGRERIYVGDVCVAEVETIQRDATVTIRHARMVMHVQGVNYPQISQAIERADEAGFWDSRGDAYYVTTQTWKTTWMHNEVTVEVPIAETSTTLTLVSEGDDES